MRADGDFRVHAGLTRRHLDPHDAVVDLRDLHLEQLFKQTLARESDDLRAILSYRDQVGHDPLAPTIQLSRHLLSRGQHAFGSVSLRECCRDWAYRRWLRPGRRACRSAGSRFRVLFLPSEKYVLPGPLFNRPTWIGSTLSPVAQNNVAAWPSVRSTRAPCASGAAQTGLAAAEASTSSSEPGMPEGLRPSCNIGLQRRASPLKPKPFGS